MKYFGGAAVVQWMHVAPLAGAWIEIKVSGPAGRNLASLPSRGRGLKSGIVRLLVAGPRRSPRGGVD